MNNLFLLFCYSSFNIRKLKNLIKLITVFLLLHLYTLEIALGCAITCTPTYSTGNSINLGSYDPYNYVNIAIPVTLSVTCGGTVGASCGSSTNTNWNYMFSNPSQPRKLQLPSTTNEIQFKFCPNAGCSYEIASNNSVVRSYTFIPNVGRTDTETFYIVVPVQTITKAGIYTRTFNHNFYSNTPSANPVAYPTLTINMTVLDSCSISANPLNFGSFNFDSGTISASTTISVICTSGSAYQIGANAGTGSGATVSNRKITSGSDTMVYSLYTDSGYTQNWNNTVNGSGMITGTGIGSTVNHTIYGSISSTASVAAPVGSYTDTVTVTVNF